MSENEVHVSGMFWVGFWVFIIAMHTCQMTTSTEELSDKIDAIEQTINKLERKLDIPPPL